MEAFKKTTLKNGLRIISIPDKTSRAATVLVLVGTGSKYETKETNGISHLLEHLLFKGTSKRPTPIDIAEPLDNIGGAYNAFTGEEYTGYYAKVGSKHLDLAMDIISDIYLNSKLDEKEIKKEKGVVIEEINMYYDHPSSYVQVLWNKALYGDQPAGWDVAGSKESVSRLTREEIAEYMKSQYVASNTIVCAAGNIPKEKELINKIEKYFKNIRTSKPKDKLRVVESQKKPEAFVYSKNTDQTHFCLGARGYDFFSPRKYEQEILGLVLGGMMSSRLFVRIREELGLAYYVKTNVSSDTDAGYLTTQTGVDNLKAEKAIIEILKEYRRIREEAVPAKELKKAKDNLKGKMDLLLETSDALASFYGLQEIMGKEILSPSEIYAKINRITPKNIQELAKDIFRPEKLNLALIGPFKDKKRFEKLLKI